MGHMGQVLLEIEPRELKFTFELKKQSSCTVHLVNKSNDYVAFKVKTTSPKRYCVRPNTGVIPPKSTCDFTVTMQAQRTVPPDMQLKDKFLIQSTVVPDGTADEDLVPSFFSKENGRYVEENKLKVVLVSPLDSPILQPINGDVKQESIALKQDPTSFKQESVALKQDPTSFKQESVALKQDPIPLKQESIALKQDFLSFKQHSIAFMQDPVSFKQESTALKEEPISLEQEAITLVQKPVDEIPVVKETPMSNVRALNGVGIHHPFHGTKDVEDLKSKLQGLEVKLNEAEKTIEGLRKENNLIILERNKLQQEIALLRSRCAAEARVGFPFLFVLFMALVGAAFGYLLRP